MSTMLSSNRIAELERLLAECRDQHAKIWAAINGNGLPLPTEDGWRDGEFREWAVSLGRMVECPDCAFTFDACHTSEGGGYSCPACAEAQVETLREALRETIPYVNGAVHSDQPWRVETATGVLARVYAALEGATP